MMKRSAGAGTILLALVLALIAPAMTAAPAEITSPEAYFGFRLGTDKKIARWDKIVEYYKLLATESDKIQVIDVGPSTEGNPFLLLIISSPRNLANLEHLREVNKKISDPRGLTENEVKKLVAEGKAVICESMSLHATEIGGTQMAPELTYDLLSREDEETRRILDNVIFLMVPCFNPDGQILVTDWYEKTLGTEYEGVDQPWLYHKYVGHDNNRDAFQTNMIESQYMAKIMFRDWVPQAYLDHHHTSSYSARFYIPPYTEPIHPNADPLIWREHYWYGGHIAYKLEEAGKSGAIGAARYLGWGHLGFHWLTNYHNIAGMLTESARAKLATPLYIHPEQLQGDARGPIRGQAEYGPQTNFPNPWPGGWWRLRDIVEQMKIAAWALVDMAARNKETVLWNAYQKAKHQTERGANGKPAAYVIPREQHDPLTAVKMVNKLLVQGLEIERARADFSIHGMTYPAGSYLVSLAQPKMGVAKNLLERTLYPENTWTWERDGSPSEPQDTATDTMYEFMGVRVDLIDAVPRGDFETLTGAVESSGEVGGAGRQGYVLSGSLNDSFKAVNLLLDKGIRVRRVDKAGAGMHPGDFIVSAGSGSGFGDTLRDVARQTGVDFETLDGEPGDAHDVQRLRVGMYQRYWGGNIDEGWTRFVLEQFAFPYTTLMDEPIKKGGLETSYDVIILPDDPPGMITGERVGSPGRPAPPYPPEYRSGIGKEGVQALKQFVEAGGTLITFGNACELAIEALQLSVRNVLKGMEPKEFSCPGSTLKAEFANDRPAAYGMPQEGFVFFWDSPAFEILPSEHNERYETVVRYREKDILQSGRLIGEKHLSGTAGMIVAEHGRGKAVLIGFRTQHRGQTHGTFKLLFNALVR